MRICTLHCTPDRWPALADACPLRDALRTEPPLARARGIAFESTPTFVTKDMTFLIDQAKKQQQCATSGACAWDCV